MKRVGEVAIAVIVAGLLVALTESASVVSAYTVGPYSCGSTGPHAFRVDPDFQDSAAGTTTQQIDAITAGAAQWYGQTLSPFSFYYAGTTNNGVVNDSENVVIVRPSHADGRLAEANQWGNCRFDIVFFENHSWSVDGTAWDIQGVAAHEFGHALNLGHSQFSDATMYQYAASGTSMRTLEHDDVCGAEWLYGWRSGNGYHYVGVEAYAYHDDGGGARVPLYRLYRSSTHSHLLTADLNEVSYATGIGYAYQGVVGYIYATSQSGHLPLYRLYKSDHHLFTKDVNERDSLINDGWSLIGVAGYLSSSNVSGTFALGRYHNVQWGDHLYSSDGS
jgi:hypothetical protein